MAVRGTKPKPESQRRNKNQPQADWVEVANVPYAGDVPDFPETRTVVTRDGQEQVTFQSMTRAWWATVTRMPHCVLWSQSDWMFALSSALVADAAFCGISSAATELRNREKVMGTTVEYRRDLRIRYVEVLTPVESSEVANIEDYREL